MDKHFDYEWISKQIGHGEPAQAFAGHVLVWSEMAVRAAVVRALKAHEAERQQQALMDRSCIMRWLHRRIRAHLRRDAISDEARRWRVRERLRK